MLVPLSPHLKITLDEKVHAGGLSLLLSWSVESSDDGRVRGTLVSRVMRDLSVPPPDGLIYATMAKLPLARETRPVFVTDYSIKEEYPKVLQVDLMTDGEPIFDLEPVGV